MNYKELKKRVEIGEEFSFYYNDEEYWISQNSAGRYLTNVNKGTTQSFKSAEELFEHGEIEDKSLIEIWEDIKEYF